jgi:hypothetical protein
MGMTSAIEQANRYFALGVCLQTVGMLVVDHAQLKNRMFALFGNTERVPLVWVGPGTGVLLGCLTPLCLLALNIAGLLGRTAAPDRLPWTWLEKALLLAFVVGVALLWWSEIRFSRRARTMGWFALSRGRLFDSVRTLGHKAHAPFLGEMPLYLIPDQRRIPSGVWVGSGVLFPLPLLEQLTRREIDALVAWQLCRQSSRFYLPLFSSLLVCNAVAIVLAFCLHLSLAASFAIFTLLPMAEVAGLLRYLPCALLRADLRAIEITADAEALLSAVGKLSRFNGTNPDLHELAELSGTPPERRLFLLAGHAQLGEEHYPTKGSYLETGL